MRYFGTMPARKFADCRLVKIYLESVEYEGLLGRAREAGTTVSDYARGVLTNSDVPRSGKVRVGGRRADAESGVRGDASKEPEEGRVEAEPVQEVPKRYADEEAIGSVDAEVSRRSGHAVGYNCAWVCGRMRKMLEGAK